MNEKGNEDAATRAFELSLELDHPVDDVWRALTDAEELVRWFPFDAKVAPGQGGTVWLSWGDPWFFDTRIEVWRPGEHLRLIENRSDELAKDARIAMDFTLEGRGGATVLRMVHSGFGTGEEWDTEYDGISRGWAYELRCLRHYLDRHLGQSRHVAWLPQPTDVGRERAYATVFGPDALAAEGSVAGLAEGDPYRLRTAEGEVLEGRVLLHLAPYAFAGTVAAFGDGVVRFEYFSGNAVLALSLWGDREAEAREFETRWRKRLTSLL